MSDFPQRRIILTFTLKDGSVKTIEGINIKFSIQKMCYAFGGQASISIANLTMDDITYLTTFLSPFLSPEKRKKVAISAGYDDEVQELFHGDIWTALPVKRGADIWLDIKAIKSFFSSSTMGSRTITGEKMPIKDVCSKVAQWSGLRFEWLSKSKKTVDCFAYTGSITDAIRKISDLDDVIAYEEDNTLKVIDKNPQPKGIKLISEDSGMIGMPRINHFGIEVKTLLDNTVKLGSMIELQSKLVPAANGQYWVYSVIYQGSLREAPFYSIFKCRRGGGF